MKTRLLFSILALAAALILISLLTGSAQAQGPAGSNVIYHVVQRGEWVSRIAAQYGVGAYSIIAVNHLSWPYVIYPGQVLAIPNAATANEQMHLVRPGQTLFRIGVMYGVSWYDIAVANGIRYPYIIYVGQRLRIPGALPGTLEPPEQTIKNLYTWYLKESRGGRNLLFERAYRSSQFLTAGLIMKVDSMIASSSWDGSDPFLCAKTIPQGFSVDPAVVSPPQARAIVRTNAPIHAFTVALTQQGKYWKISDITCAVE